MFMRPQRESFIIQINSSSEFQARVSHPRSKPVNFSAMKLFHRFRKILLRLVFSSLPPRASPEGAAPTRRSCDVKIDPPKTSCSSYYYSSSSHYNEAIADCIEFFNKSAQEGVFWGRKSDVMV
ncbi:uncharacterized protein LOC127807125 [Diospyros lotus]|uniref:uncharacterized protein LOC127807125 n=1 Tax=Diospyros lotus TaxID=55363 RepID=UPI00224CA44F|nr:uncharacterized protein LOC127807125 [Diospyros lotus]